MTNYNDEYKNIDCIYENENLSQTLGEVLEKTRELKLELQKQKNILMSHFSSMVEKNHLLRMKQESCVHLQKLQLMI